MFASKSHFLSGTRNHELVYFPDLWIEDQLIVELKAIVSLAPEHEMKLIHYLCATGIDDGLLINFGDTVQIKRKIS